jgi:hypothetical protein
MGGIGSCKLCRSSGVELNGSHLLPANIYKKIRHFEARNVPSLGVQPRVHSVASRKCRDTLADGPKYQSGLSHADSGVHQAVRGSF